MSLREQFRISEEDLDPAAQREALLDDVSGAYASFEGWVRNHNEGKSVGALEYSAYKPLAEKEGQRIIAEALQRFDIRGANAVHRVGLLEIGGIAVCVGVCAAHRDAAFEACRYIIDEIKARVPIWKRECYSDGLSSWVNCATRDRRTSI